MWGVRVHKRRVYHHRWWVSSVLLCLRSRMSSSEVGESGGVYMIPSSLPSSTLFLSPSIPLSPSISYQDSLQLILCSLHPSNVVSFYFYLFCSCSCFICALVSILLFTSSLFITLSLYLYLLFFVVCATSPPCLLCLSIPPVLYIYLSDHHRTTELPAVYPKIFTTIDSRAPTYLLVCLPTYQTTFLVSLCPLYTSS